MSNNQNTTINFRRPPIRPNPNMVKPRVKGVNPRPKPNLNNCQNQTSQPTAQDMFLSLTQAYNNMVSNLQFMNAVNIVNGIYQNASNLQNQFVSPYLQQQTRQQNSEQSNINKSKENGKLDLTDEKEKQAFFNEFYEYLTTRMAKDNAKMNLNAENIRQEKDEELKLKTEQNEPLPEVEETRLAVIEAKEQNLSLKDYLNQECVESDFDQFAFAGFSKIEDVKPNCEINLVLENDEEAGAIVDEEDYNLEEINVKLSEIEMARENAKRLTEETIEHEINKEEALEKDNGEQIDSNEENDELIQKEQEKVQLNDEIRQIEKELKELEESIDSNDGNNQEKLSISKDQIEDENNFDTELIFNKDDTAYEKYFENQNSEIVENEREDDFEVPEEPQIITEDLFIENKEESNDNVTKDAEIENSNLNLEEKIETSENINYDDYSDIFVDEIGDSLNYNMVSKIVYADEEIKSIYNEIKNSLLSYKGIKSRFSFACESFRLSRKLMAKFVIIGKTIKLYLALNVNDFPNNIYHQKDESKKKAYIDVPFMVKIKSPLSIRKAKELIGKMMEINDIKINSKYLEKDYVQELMDADED